MLLYRAANIPTLPILQLEFLLQAMKINVEDMQVSFVSVNLVVFVKNVCSAHIGMTHVNSMNFKVRSTVFLQ